MHTAIAHLANCLYIITFMLYNTTYRVLISVQLTERQGIAVIHGRRMYVYYPHPEEKDLHQMEDIYSYLRYPPEEVNEYLPNGVHHGPGDWY